MDLGVSSVPANVGRLQVLLDSWKAFDLEAKKAALDTEATALATNKEVSVQARKNLAKQTQDFKKKSDEEKLQNIGSLLKLYQEEIDHITKRCKAAETTFVTLYKHLSDVQDPAPALEVALEQAHRSQRTSDLELENKKLHETLSEYHSDFQDIKNQEVTIRRLEDKVKEYEAHMESLVSEQAVANARKLRDEHIMEIELLREREVELRKQVTTAHEELAKVRRSYDTTQSQHLDLQVKYGEVLASRQAEVDLLASDLERANSLNATLERERELWRNMQEEGSSAPLHLRKGLDLELSIAQKEIEIIRLNEQLQTITNALSTERERATKERQDYDQVIANLKTRCNELAAASAAHPSQTEFESLMKELAILRAMVYGDESETKHMVPASAEQVLKEKNRHLEAELLRTKLSLGEKETEAATLQAKITELEATCDEQQALITKLEEDLTKGASHPLALDVLMQAPQLNASGIHVTIVRLDNARSHICTKLS